MHKQLLRCVIALTLALGISTLGSAKDDDDVNGKKFEQLSADINALNAELSALSAQLTTFNAQFSLLSAEVGAIGAQVNGLNSQLGALSSQVGGLNSQVGALSSQVGALDSEVGTLGSQVGSFNSQLTALTARVSALEADGTGGGSTAPAVVNVDCGAGQKLADALTNTGVPLTINVTGVCNENITVRRDDVTLVAGPSGATINGPNATANTINVVADRVTIDGLTVTGGANGIVATGAGRFTLRNCTAGPTPGAGIVIFHESQASIDKCTVQSNGADGIAVQASTAVITQSTINANGRAGIIVSSGGVARIGLPNAGPLLGNTITNNSSTGVYITIGATASIGGNMITGNGVGPNFAFGRDGVGLLDSNADLVAANTITGNLGFGVQLTGSAALIGDGGFGTTPNVMSGNSNGGLFASLGSMFTVNRILVQNNTGNGISLNTRSTMQMNVASTISNNTGSGVAVQTGGAAVMSVASITGNNGFGVFCSGSEASVITGPGVSGNVAGDIHPDCTGF